MKRKREGKLMNADKKIRIYSSFVMAATFAVSALCLAWAANAAMSSRGKIAETQALNAKMNAKIAAIASKCDFYEGIEKTLLNEDAMYSGTPDNDGWAPNGLADGYFPLEECGKNAMRSIKRIKGARGEYIRFSDWCGRLFKARPISKPLYIRMEVPDAKMFGGEAALLEIDAVYSFDGRGE